MFSMEFTSGNGCDVRLGTVAGEVAEPYRVLVIADFPTGFDEKTLREIGAALHARERTTSPFAQPLPRMKPPPHFTKPDLVAQVAFAEWTEDGRLRQPVFLGLRVDKPARDVVRERADG